MSSFYALTLPHIPKFHGALTQDTMMSFLVVCNKLFSPDDSVDLWIIKIENEQRKEIEYKLDLGGATCMLFG